MKISPILFSTPMVQAILENRKTQTRRIVKHRISWERPTPCNGDISGFSISDKRGNYIEIEEGEPCTLADIGSPYGEVGDTLWVKEPYFQFGKWEYDGYETTKTGKLKRKFVPLDDDIVFSDTYTKGDETYRLEMGDKNSSLPGWFKRLSRFMPKKYARIFLKITDVRVERLQDISPKDAAAEGILPNCECKLSVIDGYGCTDCQNSGYATNPVYDFQELFESINGADSWRLNDWVWVISFTKTEKPEGWAQQ